MNQYPLWKYLLILASLLAGLIYTLPNLYGESPAVQVSPLRSNLKADAALKERVENILKTANLDAELVMLEDNSVKARFANTDSQLKAKDVLAAQLGEDYVAALNLLPRSPRWLTDMHALPMYLGLDLRGGVHFLLQVDMNAALTKSLDSATEDIRSALRDKDIPYTGVDRDGDMLVVKFRDADARSKGETELKQRYSDYALNDRDQGRES